MKRREVLRLTAGTAAAMSVVTFAKDSTDNNKSNSAQSRKTIATRLTDAMNIQHPFVCAGMGMVCDTTELGIAVARAGGVGAIAGSLLSPAVLRKRIAEIRAATDKPFHINFLSVFPHEPQVQVCIEQKVPIVSFHFGVPGAEIVKRLQAANISVWVQVGSVADAKKASDAGADGIIAQGNEAGGHTFVGMPLLALLPAIRDVIADKLLLGAGGIADGRTTAAALASGADGVWVGTRLVATTEANAHPEYKRRLVEAHGEDTIITHVYGPEFPAFNPMRVINNDTVTTWQDRVNELPKDRSQYKSIGRTLFAGQEQDVKPFDSIIPVRETTGDFEQMPMLAGQGVGLVNNIEPAQVVVEKLMHDAATVVEDFSTATTAI